MCTMPPQRPENSAEPSGYGVASAYELADVGAVNKFWSLIRSGNTPTFQLTIQPQEMFKSLEIMMKYKVR